MALEPPDFYPADSLVAVWTVEPLDKTLDYKAPEGGVRLGAYVAVPLGPRKVLGVVWGPGDGGWDPAKIRRILGVIDVPPMGSAMRGFLAKAADYTLTPMPMMIRLATRAPGIMDPPGSRKVLRLTQHRPDRVTDARQRVIAFLEEHGGMAFAPGELAEFAGVSGSVLKGLQDQGVLQIEAAPRDGPFPRLDPDVPGRPLSEGQHAAAIMLREAVRSAAYGTTLLKGVTGSGKTEVYLEAVAACLATGRQALVLLPEIALTAEFMARVEARFGAEPIEWHSGVTMANRRRAWKAAATGKGQLFVGARSALFLPFARLGLIVVDEEHDGSYKQEEGAIYHARDMAVLRAHGCGAQVILASATPSLESWANADAGKYARIDLTERFGDAVLPQMATIDLRAEELPRDRWITESLASEISARLETGEQSLLFLNRRGYAPVTMCRACGTQIGCDHCDARMVEHRFIARLMCHQCGETKPLPKACPSCGREDRLGVVGPGVERLAEEAALRFPEARVAVLSSDLADSARALKARIEEIAAGGADIVIGTQMVAKGHNFPLLTLVGVIDADLGLHGSDLRAAERTFQLVRQVAGRAGRADRPGVALIQTAQPDHPVIQAILGSAGEDFWAAEARERLAAGSPPYGRMVGVVVSGPEEARTFDIARALARDAGRFTALGAQVLGPAPAPIARIRGRSRVRLLIKAPKGAVLQGALKDWRDAVKLPAQYRITIDIDPQTFF